MSQSNQTSDEEENTHKKLENKKVSKSMEKFNFLSKEIEKMNYCLSNYNSKIDIVDDLISLIPNFLVDKQKIKSLTSYKNEFSYIIFLNYY